MTARFITFEGGEGAGKSTQARLFADALRASGHEVLLTREPGGTAGAERVRQLILDPAGEWSPAAEILLHFAARADHVDRAIAPALARGAAVVSDRFYDSTRAYQGSSETGGLIETLIGQLPVRPGLTFILEVGPRTRLARVAARGAPTDRYEARDDAFHARVAANYRAIAAAEPHRCRLISAEGAIDDVHRAVMENWRHGENLGAS